MAGDDDPTDFGGPRVSANGYLLRYFRAGPAFSLLAMFLAIIASWLYVSTLRDFRVLREQVAADNQQVKEMYEQFNKVSAAESPKFATVSDYLALKEQVAAGNQQVKDLYIQLRELNLKVRKVDEVNEELERKIEQLSEQIKSIKVQLQQTMQSRPAPPKAGSTGR